MRWQILSILCAVGLSLASRSLASAQPQSFVVTSVHVDHSGLWRADPNGHQTVKDCKAFVLRDPEALKWFQASSEVDQHTWLEELDWTQCSAEGKLQTGDGRAYRWELDQSGRGRVILSKSVSVFLKGIGLP